MTFAEKYNLQIADAVEVHCRRSIFCVHYGIYYIENGVEYLFENTIENGVVQSTIDFFRSKYPKIIKVRKFNGNDDGRQKVIERAKQELGKPHNWLTNNCEQFANYAQYGVRYSKQEILVGIGLVGILYLIFK